jgi:hypothetical protein
MQPNNNKIGALWVATDKITGQPKINSQGNAYYTGNLEINGKKMNIVMFKNNKTKPTQPDFNILLSAQPQNPNQQAMQNPNADAIHDQLMQVNDLPF